MKKLYIFDFDGMIVDSYRDSIKYFNQTLEEFGLPTFDEELEGLDYQNFRLFLKNKIKGHEKEFNQRFTENYKDAPQLNTKPYKGITEVLKTLLKEDKTLAICSNREQKNLETLTYDLFPEIEFKYISGDKDFQHNKPDPYRINEIIEQENIDKDEVIYFGDKIADVLAAEKAEIDMVLVTYGQGNHEAYSNPYPLQLIDTPEEILEIKR